MDQAVIISKEMGNYFRMPNALKQVTGYKDIDFFINITLTSQHPQFGVKAEFFHHFSSDNEFEIKVKKKKKFHFTTDYSKLQYLFGKTSVPLQNKQLKYLTSLDISQ